MPNTLGHIGVHLPLTRAMMRRAEPAWMLLGCVLPDVPWILQRVLLSLTPIDEVFLRLHSIGQASLFGSLLLAGALAALARGSGRTFATLTLGALMHLLLDACQIKWANGVSFFAPFDWRLVRFDLFWPEDWATLVFTALGLFVFGREVMTRRSHTNPASLLVVTGRRATLAGAFAIAWLLWPIADRNGPVDADCQFIATLVDVEGRPGRWMELDRVRYVPGDEGHTVITFADEVLELTRPHLEHRARVSVRGRFVDRHTLDVEGLHDHTGTRLPVPLRDVFSYVGLALVLFWWLRALPSPRR